MAPPRQPPELMAELVDEILLRLPSDDPACLARASLVCKPWCHLLSDPAFLHRYRAFHRAPPLLDFLANFRDHSDPRFVPVSSTAPCPFDRPGFHYSRCLWVMDCRHGHVLLHEASGDSEGLIAWDPITGDRCAWDPIACVYSSKAGAWGAPASRHLGLDSYVNMNHGALIGDELYSTPLLGGRILKYDMDKNCLSPIDPPGDDYGGNVVLMLAEDGPSPFVAENFYSTPK
ncbi:uncharacterized protein LOC133906008 [Phragmites australis]|uniref:uncharacterized protein LOC133906008 n=1 Tax=Phragmites australis TaxID=29695 RepID=UPI002D779C7B|nr:uncharacterized protein LOC133906008 [Phragmites australis]